MLTKELSADETVIREVLQGDVNRYEVLIRKYNQQLYRVAKGILWEEELIEDVMQEAYIKAYQHLGQFMGRSGFRTWLTRILINECLQKKRKLKKTAGERIEDHLLHAVTATTPENLTMNSELKKLLEDAIAYLPEKYRVVFVLREIENMSITETSESLGITEGNVKARLSRGKEMLREYLTALVPYSELLEFNLVRCDRVVFQVMASVYPQGNLLS